MTKSIRYAFVTAVLLALVVGVTAPALAHEVRKVGNYQFTVGWGEEPAYAGFRNSVQFILKDLKGNAVTDLTDSLKVDVVFQSQTETLMFQPTFDPDTKLGTPGDYRAWLIPTRPGDYTFHFHGTIHGQKVDQSFTSSSTTFDAVKAPSEAQFPAKDPTNGDLSNLVQAVDGRTAAAKSVADKGKSTASTAMILAIVGLVLGAGGLAAGIAGRRKKAA